MCKERENTIETRLNDVKNEYNTNQLLINKLLKEIKKFDDLFIKNSNGTFSVIPPLKIYQDLTNTNIKLRKQINDMELLIQNGTLTAEEEYSPFV